MPDLKLGKLPNRTPVKMTISVMPDYEEALRDYAAIHSAQHGVASTSADIASGMVEQFITNDREFAKARAAFKAAQSTGHAGQVRGQKTLEDRS
ncbi:hypothetical protein PMI01_04663 [Caulobacter sp. AP07]|uniref:DUF2274 domain-containing protein n=1 Tax=Caulobacter sp. AP07 TaxID=1144304 RepID=UPI00027225C3|nr:DUF2274 domain-containing protein [Caulobacter sp. AP07]EJL24482.1 hypothetical protein PMI01_04663 [Caulobacter sp. AP07]